MGLLRPPLAHLAAWASLAVIDVLVITLTLDAETVSSRTRALHLGFDVGHCLAAGLLSAAAITVWERARIRHRLAAPAAQMLVAVVVGLLTLLDDLRPRAGALAAGGSVTPWLLGMLAAAAALIPLMAVVGRLARGSIAAIVTVLVGLGLASANHLVLAQNYPGVHLFVAWGAAVLVAESIARPASAAPPPARGLARWARLASLLLACAVAGASVVARIPDPVLVEMLRRPGTVFAPWLARLHVARALTAATHHEGPFWQRRDGMPEVPATGLAPRVLGKGSPVVIAITVDCLRADVLTGDLYRSALPSLFALRDRSVHFTDARTPAPATIVALTSIFTGKLFSQLEWRPRRDAEQAFPHEDRSPRFTSLLADAGHAVVHVHGSEFLNGDRGVATGFTEEIQVPAAGGRFFPLARPLMDAAIARMEQLAPDQPAFFFMHFMDPHAPYDLGSAEGTPFERYLSELSLVDRELGRLEETLARTGLAERTVLILSADHGEAFGEHDTEFHGVTMYDELLRVPLLVAGPELAPRSVATPVSLLDLGPTVLDLAGLPTPASFMGQSLVPELVGEPRPLSRPLVAESGRRQQVMVFPDGHKVIDDRHRGHVQIYDLKSDPGERRNLIESLGASAEPYVATSRAFFDTHALILEGYVPPFRPP